MTEGQEQKMQQIEQNDQELDGLINDIGDIVADLGDLANAINQVWCSPRLLPGQCFSFWKCEAFEQTFKFQRY